MSKMNEQSVDYEAYEAYEEAQRQELRKEGAEEFRKAVLLKLHEIWEKAFGDLDQDKLKEAGAFAAASLIVEDFEY